MLEFVNSALVSNRFNSLLASGQCTLVAGANQGQRAWGSWIKIFTPSGARVQESSKKDENFDVRSTVKYYREQL
jgi:hypothetical protein